MGKLIGNITNPQGVAQTVDLRCVPVDNSNSLLIQLGTVIPVTGSYDFDLIQGTYHFDYRLSGTSNWTPLGYGYVSDDTWSLQDIVELGTITKSPVSCSFAITASVALTAQSLIGSIESASYAAYAETANVLLGSVETASYALVAEAVYGSIESASFASTASYVSGYATTSDLSSHTTNTSNPHSVTATQVGLGNVDNTSDLNKPISTATQTALNLKLNISSTGSMLNPYATTSALSGHTTNTSNPHSVTQTQVGLSNVNNTSDLNKPISTATQTALNLKLNISETASIVVSSASHALVADVATTLLGSVETASYALVAETVYGSIESASYATYAETANTLLGSVETASYALVAQTLLGSVVSASYASTASFVSGYATTSQLSAHTTSTSNPHSVTATQVGLSNVDNTSDINKPISTATQNALNLKLNISATSSMSVLSASYASTAGTLLGSIESASYSTTSSYSLTAQTLLGSITSASYAVTSSYSLTAQTLLGSVVSASYSVSSSHTQFARTADDANTLNGEAGGYYIDFSNFTNVPDFVLESETGSMSVLSSSFSISASYSQKAALANEATTAVMLDNELPAYYLNATNINGGTIADAYLPNIITSTASWANNSLTASLSENSTNLNNQAASYYLNATNINAGTINDAYLPNSITSTASFATSASYANTIENRLLFVNHGSTAGTARPNAAIVYWVGTVSPTNAINSDMWFSGSYT